jgi:Winged helix DNA-binding domain
MVPMTVALQRLTQQRLTQNPLATPEEVVAWLGAVQAQDYQGAKWALYQRMREATDSAIERAVTNGSILRTHIMRPTWHFVTPADIRWMQALTASRNIAGSARMYRLHELDDTLLARSSQIIASALRGGRYLTRAELGSALAEAGIVATGLRLTLIVHRAELDAIVCSGPLRGKQFTYALLDERAPISRSLARDEALVELVRRYYTGHGPATIHDFAWWSGLTIADARAGVDMAGAYLAHEVFSGRTYWMSASMLPAAEPHQTALLLPTYDEFLVGYDGFDVSRRAGRPASESGGTFDSTLVVGGRVVGSWKRTFQKGAVAVDVTPFVPLNAGERQAVEAAARQYGEFVGKPVLCTIA